MHQTQVLLAAVAALVLVGLPCAPGGAQSPRPVWRVNVSSQVQGRALDTRTVVVGDRGAAAAMPASASWSCNVGPVVRDPGRPEMRALRCERAGGVAQVLVYCPLELGAVDDVGQWLDLSTRDESHAVRIWCSQGESRQR